jgi:transcriptional regulator with XRE-family HTH domain
MRKSDINEDSKKVLTVIGNNILRLRGRMSQEELENKAGVSRSVISAIENGKSISLTSLIKLAKALNVEPQDLFISEKRREELSYMTVKLLEKVSESAGVKPEKKN